MKDVCEEATITHISYTTKSPSITKIRKVAKQKAIPV